MEPCLGALQRVRDPRVWSWFSDRVHSQRLPWASPGCVLPAAYEAVVRVLHPATDGSTWADVARQSGRTAHPLMQWTRIEGRCGRVPGHNTGEMLAYGDRCPEIGDAPTSMIEAVLEHVPAQRAAYFGVWAGCGQWADDAEADLLEIPHRAYRVFEGPQAAHRLWPGMLEPTATGQSAHLIWPPDHSWVIATEVDWMFTLVAGSASLAEALLADPRLECHRVAFDDDLSDAGDRINPSFLPR